MTDFSSRLGVNVSFELEKKQAPMLCGTNLVNINKYIYVVPNQHNVQDKVG